MKEIILTDLKGAGYIFNKFCTHCMCSKRTYEEDSIRWMKKLPVIMIRPVERGVRYFSHLLFS